MELDCQVTVKGLPEETSRRIGNTVAGMVKALSQGDEALDLRRMSDIVITVDLAGELAELSRRTASGNPITYTAEAYATAIGKVLILPRGDDREIVLVLDARIRGFSAPTAYHLWHHELCHVHDSNKHLDAFPTIMLRQCYEGKDIFVRPLAERCWSEYVAVLMSSPTATNDWVAAMTNGLADAIARTRRKIDREILWYRFHGDLNHLMQEFQRHGDFLPEVASYVLGYIDGLGKPLSELCSPAAERLRGSYFETTWNALQEALREMKRLYPDGWKDLSVYDDLARVLEDYYSKMGLVLSTTDNGVAYVDVPFRSGTTPNPNDGV